MEQTSQVGAAPARGAPPAPGVPVEPVASLPAAADPAADEALRGELAKWRERVPKLAAALRQRAEEAETLKQELERLRHAQPSAPNASAGIRARDELIGELEGKLADLAERHKTVQGELHMRQLAVAELQSDVEAWRGKWQSVTRSLDDQAAQVCNGDDRSRGLEDENADLRRRLAEQVMACEAAQRALDETVEERDSLRRRNQQLFETTELANRQIGSLTDSLTELRTSVKQHRERASAAGAERDGLRTELALLQDRLAAAQQAAAALAEELHMVLVAAASGATLQASVHEQTLEVERLTQVVAQAQHTTSARERERRALSEQLQAVEARNQHLEQQLSERSVLVVTLEEDQAAAAERQVALQQERDELEEALIRAERHVRENAEHVAQLDAKLERQQELMLGLEEELAEANDEHARAVTARRPGEPAAAESEVVRLQEQVRKLEGLVRERTDALNRLEWRREITQSEGRNGAAVATAGLSEAGAAKADDKLLLVLNQQLVDARACNDTLLARVRELEAQVPDGGRRCSTDGPTPSGDDLTRIHGVGQKLAEQLNDLGFYHYRQIAELDQSDLCDTGHALHGHRGRILRDGWIEQAVKLSSH